MLEVLEVVLLEVMVEEVLVVEILQLQEMVQMVLAEAEAEVDITPIVVQEEVELLF